MCKPIRIGEYIKGRAYMAHQAVAAQPVNAYFSVLQSVAFIALGYRTCKSLETLESKRNEERAPIKSDPSEV